MCIKFLRTLCSLSFLHPTKIRCKADSLFMYKLMITTAASLENNYHLSLVHIYSVALITGWGGGCNYEQLLPHLTTAIHMPQWNPVQNNPNQIFVFCTFRGPTASWGPYPCHCHYSRVTIIWVLLFSNTLIQNMCW